MTHASTARRDLYFFLMYRNDIPHRFFTARNLFGSSLRNLIEREQSMLDVLMLTIAFVFFALAIGYSYACDRL
jgi:hypothetical protein